jgi:hypothetical protein
VVAAAPAIRVEQSMQLLQEHFRPAALSIDFGVILLTSALAIVVLPRQFFMGLAEARDPHDLHAARFGLAAYIAPWRR